METKSVDPGATDENRRRVFGRLLFHEGINSPMESVQRCRSQRIADLLDLIFFTDCRASRILGGSAVAMGG